MTYYFKSWSSWSWNSWNWHDWCQPKNTKPIDCDDRAKTCENKNVYINVLANDYDKEDCKADLKIKIGNEILDYVGETVDLASGATVTLGKHNRLIYNTDNAFEGLRSGQTATDTFRYSLIDTKGAESDGAKVTVTVCGETDTLGEIAASLPRTVMFSITDENVPIGVSDEAYTGSISGSGDSRLDGLEIAETYCLSLFKPLTTGTPIEAKIYIADIASVPDGALSPEAIKNLDLINWVLNQDFGSQGYTDAEIQGAIWKLTDDKVLVADGGGTRENALEIVSFARKNGEGFEVGDGDVVGLFVDPTNAATVNTGHDQPFILAIEFDDLVESCECASSHWC